MQERIQKVLAQAGIASRRHAEDLVVAGRVRVNGKTVTELGTRVDPRSDRIEVDGKRIVRERPVYLVLHKPRGIVTTVRDPEGRPTVRDLTKELTERLYPVGRLDWSTSGVLLLTNDGEFAQGLLHPKKAVPKTYVVKLSRIAKESELEQLRTGVELADGKTAPADVHALRVESGKSWIRLGITEGRNHQVRRMAEAVGFRVMRLARIEFAGIDAEGLRPGQYRYLSADELKSLRKAYRVPRRIPRQDHRHIFGKPTSEGLRGQSESKRRDLRSTKKPAMDRASDRRDGRRGERRVGERGRSREERAPRERDERFTRERSRAERPTRGRAREERGQRDARGRDQTREERATRGQRDARGRDQTRDERATRGRGEARGRDPSREKRATRGRDQTHDERASGRRAERPGRGRARDGGSDRDGSRGRYGGGVPGRKNLVGATDWNDSAPRRGRSGGARRPEQGRPPGRGDRTATTGSGGGIGAERPDDPSYRLSRSRRGRR